jgi:hypothetical protein
MKAFWRGVTSIGEGMASIGEGMAGLMDLSGEQTRVKLKGPADDAEALRRDWEAVGNDLWKVLEEAGIKRDGTDKSSVD